MKTPKENFLETIRGGSPDRFVKQYEALGLAMGDPVNVYVRGNRRYPGMEPSADRWGTRIFGLRVSQALFPTQLPR